MRDRVLRLTIILVALSFVVGKAFGHARGENYIFASFNETTIEGEFQVNYEDLEQKLGITVPSEPAEALEVLRSSQSQVFEYIKQNLSISAQGKEPYDIEFLDALVFKKSTPFARYPFKIESGPLPDEIEINHGMFYEEDKTHRGLFLVKYNSKTDKDYGQEYTALVFGPSNQSQNLNLLDVPGLIGNTEMIVQGVYHIWIGIDHILFLLVLLLPTVLTRQQASWVPVEKPWTAIKSVLQVVTVFTIAHSVTLLLAALDLVQVNSRLVESIIALSIILVALNNVFQWVSKGSLLVILGLGLFHGLGFASVMGNLPFRMVDLVGMVVRFNIGIELGQIAIVILLFPVLYWLRRSDKYVPFVLQGLSWVMASIALVWFVQRAFGLGA